MIRYLADTNILGYFTRGVSPALRQRMQLALLTNEVAISAITRAETRFGQRLLDPKDKRQGSIDFLLNQMVTLPWPIEAADRYGEIAAQLRQSGQPIGEMDTLIAAHAMVADLTLVTHNTRHFERIPGLKLEDWMI